MKLEWTGTMKLMKRMLVVIAAFAVPTIGFSAESSTTKHHTRHHRQQGYGAMPKAIVRPVAPVSEPYMIEVRPGVWISNRDCITDEGQGRWMLCSSLGGGAGRN
jgi:hypothetical protein